VKESIFIEDHLNKKFGAPFS